MADDDYKELEGRLSRSYQTWTDVPLTQWHRWFDWNLHIVPSQPYQYLRGEGNDEAKGGAGTVPVVQGAAMECEWDTGAFGNRFGPMFERDWAWPMASQFAFVAGKWVYDCGHANNGKMRTELHPICAVATARWEAVKFKRSAQVLFPIPGPLGSDTPFMPASQFMFFASRLGGYIDTDEMRKRDYEFIVDLPRETPGRAIVPIGATPDNPRNTVTIGPMRIVAQVDFTPFSNAKGSVNSSIQPVFEVIKPDDGSFPSQVKVKIPLNKAGLDAYGVIISIGLVDQALALAKRVVLVSGSFDNVQFFNRNFGDVAVKFGVNGRWHRKFFNGVKNLDKLDLKEPFEFALALDHPPNGGGHVLFNAHGKILKPVSQGRVLLEAEADRVLRVGNSPRGREYQYVFDVLSKDAAKVSQLDLDFVDRLKGTRRIEDDALGIADFARRAAQLRLGEVPFQLNGNKVEEVANLAELVFSAGPQLDYTLSGRITAKPQ